MSALHPAAAGVGALLVVVWSGPGTKLGYGRQFVSKVPNETEAAPLDCVVDLWCGLWCLRCVEYFGGKRGVCGAFEG